MGELFASLISNPFECVALFSCAFLIGMSKTGIQGINMISIPIMAIAFGAKQSTGVILPMLCFADLIAVLYYRRSAEWKYIFRLLPSAILGFFVAILTDKFIDPAWFKNLMGFCIIGGLFLMFFERKHSYNDKNSICNKWWFSILFGLAGGFTTMISNAAGAVMAVYMLSMRMPKLNFVGTNACFFLVINYLKLPLQYFVWDNISAQTLSLNFFALPFIFLGAILGIFFIKIVPEKVFKIFIVSVTFLSAALLFF